MKNNKTLLYDDACPLCAWYTGAFVKTGLLDKEGRKAFSTASPELLQCIDRRRGVNEIPLLDSETKEVLYGIDALVAIIGQRCPFVRLLGSRQPVNWLLKKIYNFISYKRKVIVARKSAFFIIKEYFRRMEYAGVTRTHRGIVAVNLVCLAGFVASLFVL